MRCATAMCCISASPIKGVNEFDGYLRRKVEIARVSVRAGRDRSNDEV